MLQRKSIQEKLKAGIHAPEPHQQKNEKYHTEWCTDRAVRRSLVEGMKRELVQKNEELQIMKAEYEREKLQKDIILAEKKVVESRFNEIKLKLKLKTKEYDELLKSKNPDGNLTEKVSIGFQTIAREPSATVVETVEATISAPATSSTAAISPTQKTTSAVTASVVTSTAKKGVKRKE